MIPKKGEKGCAQRSENIFSRNSVPFPSVPNLGWAIPISETHGIPRKEHIFPYNNENLSEYIPRSFFEKIFDGNPSASGEPGGGGGRDKLRMRQCMHYSSWSSMYFSLADPFFTTALKGASHQFRLAWKWKLFAWPCLVQDVDWEC